MNDKTQVVMNDKTHVVQTADDGTGADDRVLWSWLWARLRSAWPLLALAVAVLVVAALTAPRPDTGLPLDPASTGPDGTRALLDVLDGLGHPARVVAPADVGDADATGDADVILLLHDTFRADDRRHAALRRRVERGARLVIADPGSPLTPDPAGDLGLADRILSRACRVAALRDVTQVRPGPGAAYDVPAGATGCFPAAAGAWLTIQQRGRGDIVALGGPEPLTNAALGRADHAVLAAQLLAPAGGGTVAVIRPVLSTAADGGDRLSALVPGYVVTMALQLLLGFALLVAHRARRLGPPLRETSPVRLANAELTSAVGGLLARNAARGAAADGIARDLRRRLARRLGLPADADADEVAAVAAERTGAERAAVAATLMPGPPVDDPELLHALAALTGVEHAVQTALSPISEDA